ncbi:phosphoenolpyruvate--protein phosphotransferase [Erythrobacter dokdonensis]|jgi:phosphotransferase system enzyme I (PtsP)|uniref:phosphoenolpyruvate--protein phosphotransferase n=1 Tax=Erythrobacter dokdonensis DSW-74 TaxID=1300349 RepID=A0A1A7BFL7_9SPHN|nr:phosphoenolpyruvate--protein phosphotransferase [Erythrobacter dokdonensis]MEE4315676.1 phosphoenolpyruvate--protein phosphotransferase [Erythrobacter sp.]OBV11284.1 Phosphoenolpyruvate-protein phosphotransferase [Erythrobacter dokdonensis DSW-74]
MSAAAAARQILTRLTEVMASRMHAQGKLDQVVEIIGECLTSEVCSIYLLREGMLELFATRGLNQSAVHVTRMAIGEGLTGAIAQKVETLNLAEAKAHPDFQYRPETGEEKFHSFAGVPIVYRERAVGVLCVQHVEPRRYEDVEIEALQTTAMVLSELITNAELVDEEEARGLTAEQTGPQTLSGLTLVKGLGAGVAVYHQPRVEITQVMAEDVEAERQRVYRAFDKMREQIDSLAGQAEFGIGGEHEEVLETYKMFAYDEGWSRRINAAIDSGLTAEAAIERVQQHTRMRMREIDDPLLADRMHDLEDLANRLLRIVAGQVGTAASQGLRKDTILIARNLGPAELLEYDKRRLKGVILEEGSLTAHVVIVARAMNVPVIGRVNHGKGGGVRTTIREGDEVLLDATAGNAIVRPLPQVADAFHARFAKSREKQAAYASLRDVEPFTRCGTRIQVMMNAGLRDDMSMLAMTGADGVGLFRTEFQFLVSATLPQRERQTRLYRDVLDAAGDKPVIFRTVDIGGDKSVPYLASEVAEHDENPAMGWRALRLALEREGLMKVQARSLLEAAAGRSLYVMFPMVSEPWEFDAAKAVFDEQLAYLRTKKRLLPERIHFGAMLEVPALAEMLDVLLPKLSFLSIGTNDLTQFLFAADRANPKLAERYDWLSPSILRFLRRVMQSSIGSGVDIGVCGEMGGRRLEALALMGIGYRRLSITPAAVGPIKELVRKVDLAELTAAMADWLADPQRNLRAELAAWAAERNIEYD